MNKFSFREGFRCNVDAETAALELERIRVANQGRLIPKDIVIVSTPEEAPLHPAFEWSDEIAAGRYREWQARNLIKAVRIIDAEPDGNKINLPVFVHTRVTNSEGKEVPYYQSAQVAVTRPDEWMLAVEEAKVKLAAAKRAIDDLERIAAGYTGPDGHDKMARFILASKSIDTALAALLH